MLTPANSVDINELIGRVVDHRRNGLYCRVRLPKDYLTPASIRCFDQCVGELANWDQRHVLTPADTNLSTAGMLNPPMDAIAARFLFVFDAAQEHAEFIRNYAWRFWIMRKYFQQQPMMECTVSGLMSELTEGYGTGPIRVNEKGETEGFVSVIPFARRYSYECGNLASYIPPLCQFKIELVGNPITPIHDLDFFVIIDGSATYAVR